MTSTNSQGLLDEVRELCDQIVAVHSADSDTEALTIDRRLTAELERAGLLDLALLGPNSTDLSAREHTAVEPLADIPATAVITALATATRTVPVVEHLWNAGYLLHAAQLTPGLGLRTAAFSDTLSCTRIGNDLILSGTATDIAHVEGAEELVVLTQDGTVAQIPTAELEVLDTKSLGALSWSSVKFDEVTVPAGAHGPSPLTRDHFRERNTIGRLIQIRAAAERATELTISHLSSRVQFGRPLKKFQAAQNRLSSCIGENILLGIGADLALAGRPADIALARVDARRSVNVIRDNTHQLHGAMGITAEYPLGRLGTNMLAWLADTGSDRSWSGRAKTFIDERGPWATITGEEDET